MMAVRVKDELNDTWLVLDHVTHVREVAANTNMEATKTKDLKVFFGGEYELLLNWNLDKWEAFISQFIRRMQLSGGRAQ